MIDLHRFRLQLSDVTKGQVINVITKDIQTRAHQRVDYIQEIAFNDRIWMTNEMNEIRRIYNLKQDVRVKHVSPEKLR